MTNRHTILVIGATGNVGHRLVSHLVADGTPVRAMVRDPQTADLPRQVDVVRGDLSAPETLIPALDGIESVFLVWPFLTADAGPAVLDVMRDRCRHVVYLSSMSVRDDLAKQTNPIDAFHADIEQMIRRSGLDWTFIRSSGMATNTLRWSPQIREDGVVRWFHGGAVRSLVHERDVAAVAAVALTTPGQTRKTHVVTGPAALSQTEQLDLIGVAIGQSLRWEELSPADARRDLLSGMPTSVVDGILDAHARFVTEPEPTTDTVDRLTGAPARSYGQWTVDHAGDFR